jgi:hypothetical protein
MLLAAAPVWSAGGHFAVDDAFIVGRGECLVESWIDRARSASGEVVTVAPACHVKGAELAFEIDRVRIGDQRDTVLRPQLKWAWEAVPDGWYAGFSTAVEWSDDERRVTTYSMNAPLSWDLDPFLVHANIGYDRVRGEGGTWRGGGAVEWPLLSRVDVIAEVFREFNVTAGRGGMRLHLAEAWSVDASYLAETSSGGLRAYTLGLNWLVDVR